MSDKNFMAYGDAETVLTGFATDIKAKQPKTLETPLTIEGQQQTTVEGALGALVGSVADGKTSIASAITSKGVQTASNATFDQMATNVGQIPSGYDYSNQIILASVGTTGSVGAKSMQELMEIDPTFFQDSQGNYRYIKSIDFELLGISSGSPQTFGYGRSTSEYYTWVNQTIPAGAEPGLHYHYEFTKAQQVSCYGAIYLGGWAARIIMEVYP